ncbi:MAG: hypothetical protein OET79_02850 [Nitrospirota bacterium]|nr:hypothetical protein [Nitrospirota bacterium]
MDRCDQYKAHLAAHEAFVRGDMDALKVALGQPSDFPNNRLPMGTVE